MAANRKGKRPVKSTSKDPANSPQASDPPQPPSPAREPREDLGRHGEETTQKPEISSLLDQLQDKVRELETAKDTEASLRVSEERLRLALNAGSMGTWEWDFGHDVVSWDSRQFELFGIRSEEFDSTSAQILARVHPDDRPRIEAAITQTQQAGVPFREEFRVQHPDGSVHWLTGLAKLLTDEGGQPTRIIGVNFDVTERKQAVDAVVRRLAAIIESSADAIYSKDLDGTIRTWNGAAERLYGYAAEEAVGHSAQGLVPDDRADEWAALMVRLARGENVEQVETERLCKHGKRLPVSLTFSPIRNFEGQVVSISAIARDISTRKRAEEERRVLTERLQTELRVVRRLQEVSSLPIQIGDRTAFYERLVDAAIYIMQSDMASMQKFDPERGELELLGSKGFHPKSARFWKTVHLSSSSSCSAALRDGKRYIITDTGKSDLLAGTADLEEYRRSGIRTVQSTPLVSRSGRLLGMISTHWRDPHEPLEHTLGLLDLLARQAADILDRYQAEEAVRDREERLRAIVETAMEAIITVDYQGIIRSVNPAAEHMFGYKAAEIIGRNVSTLMASPYREAHDAYITKYLKTGESHIIGTSREVDARRKDGSVFPTDLAVNEIKHLKLFVGVHRDLTERKQLERELVEAASLEQRRIGEDLHDRVGQELTALNMMVDDLAETLRTDPERALHVVERMTQGLRRSQRELREALRGLLFVSISAKGLTEALAELAERAQSDGKVNCTFRCQEPVSLPDGQNAAHIYLIAREAVHNSLKHAQARNIDINLAKMDGGLVLKVKDDGVGVAASPAEHTGLGLRIMRGRAAIIGAKLTIEPCHHRGTLVTCAWQRTGNVQEQEQTGPDPDC